MAYNRITWLPKVLRDAGLEVVEHDGWRTRGLSATQPFDPQYVVWHHDASAVGDSPGVPAYMIRNFASAGAQLWVDRKGRWHIIASGRAAHAGTVLPGKPNNHNSIGIETDHTTGEQWPPALLESLRKGTAAIARYLDMDPERMLHFHKSICSPPGRKTDPDGLSLDAERQRVSKDLAALERAKAPAVRLKRLQKAATRAGWARNINPAKRRDVKRVKAALLAEGCATYKAWQARKGVPATGIPDLVSLTKLGKRHGFRVIA